MDIFQECKTVRLGINGNPADSGGPLMQF